MSGLEALKAIGELKENGVKINTTEEYKIVETELTESKEYEKELIAEQHRLFDLAKEQEEALKIIVEKNVIILWVKLSNSVEQYNNSRSVEEYHLTPKEFGLLKKVMKDYGEN